MTNEIIPQDEAFIECGKCAGLGYLVRAQRTIRCSDCGELGRHGNPHIVTLNPSAFVAALEREQDGQPALNALASLILQFPKASVVDCSYCGGCGKVVDPFSDNEDEETCPRCDGSLKVMVLTVPANLADSLPQIANLATDLRAALNGAKGTTP